MSAAVDALSNRCRVITGSLAGDRGSVGVIDPVAGFESHVDWVDALLDRAGLTADRFCSIVGSFVVVVPVESTREYLAIADLLGDFHT